MRQKIELTMDTMDTIRIMSEGNPGAISVIMKLMENDPDKGIFKILDLDDMNIRGSQIWVGYKDHCGQDLEKFKQAIHDRDPEMVRTINRECFHPEMENKAYQHKATIGSASFDRPSA